MVQPRAPGAAPASEQSCKRGLSTDSNASNDDSSPEDSNKGTNDDASPEDRDSTMKAGAGCHWVLRAAVAVLLILIAAGVAVVFWKETHIGGGAANEAPAVGDAEIAAGAGFGFISTDDSATAAAENEGRDASATDV